eukprot:2106597-Rhodomonas_salina.1
MLEKGSEHAICLCACYAMSSTAIDYLPTRVVADDVRCGGTTVISSDVRVWCCDLLPDGGECVFEGFYEPHGTVLRSPTLSPALSPTISPTICPTPYACANLGTYGPYWAGRNHEYSAGARWYKRPVLSWVRLVQTISTELG